MSIEGAAGIGKSRFVSEIIHMTHQRDFAVYGGECEAYGVNTSYLVWQPIWRGLFGVESEWEGDEQIRRLEERVSAIDPALVGRVPLLGAVLNLAIADNELTQSFDAKLRKTSLEGLLADCLRGLLARQTAAARARGLPLARSPVARSTGNHRPLHRRLPCSDSACLPAGRTRAAEGWTCQACYPTILKSS